MFSFVIPSYNENRIFKSIDSFLAADKSDGCEAIVVINGSSDEYISEVSIRYKANKNVRIINISNKGISYARNVGILLSKFDYIVYMDSDCYIDPNYISVLSNHRLRFDIITGPVIFESFNSPLNQAYADLRTMWYKYPLRLYSPNLVIKKELFSKYGFYDPYLSGCEDSEFSERLDHDKLDIVQDSNLIMYHQPDRLSRVYRTWITYGHLRSILLLKDYFFYNIRLSHIIKRHFFKFTKYKLARGLSFFVILFFYSIFRFIGTAQGLFQYKYAFSYDYFIKRNNFLKSEAFVKTNLDSVIREF